MRGASGAALVISLLLLAILTRTTFGAETNDDILSSSLFSCGTGPGCLPEREEVCLLSLLSGGEDEQQQPDANRVVEMCVAGGDLWVRCLASGRTPLHGFTDKKDCFSKWNLSKFYSPSLKCTKLIWQTKILIFAYSFFPHI